MLAELRVNMLWKAQYNSSNDSLNFRIRIKVAILDFNQAYLLRSDQASL